ncbi:MAG: peptidoglycan DD-metalloendopeptidase family protein [Deltaproteobacteria bacterium]|nr:peptidoglycan DD-metalloendopeptidase family protein [Deltaproteobacteria bacterium]
MFIIKKIFKGLILSFLVCLLASLSYVQPSFSESERCDLSENIQKKRGKAKSVQQKIRKKKGEIKTFTRQERRLLSELDSLDRTIEQAKRRLKNLFSEESYIQTQMTKIEQERALHTKELEILEEHTAKRLIAYYKLGRLGIVPILFSAQSFIDLWQRYHALETILSYDVQVWNDFQKKKKELNSLTESLENRHKDIKKIKVKILKEQRTIASEKTKRIELLAHVRNKKESAHAALEELVEASRRLDNTIKQLKKAAKKETKRTTKRMPLFSAQKGRLLMPVAGSIVTSFGRYKHPTFNIYHFQNGIDIKAKEGTTIRAVYDGTVIYAGWFKGYGNIIIIDHDEGYYTLSAHALSLSKKVGDRVKGGETIGVVGDTGSLKGPGLYFEIRHHGKPTDPVAWLKRSKKGKRG